MTFSIAIVGRRGTVRTESGGPPRWTLTVLVVLAVMGVIVRGHGASSASSEKKRLTVLTYNMQLGSEREGNRSYREQLALLKRIDADIIGLQESDTARPPGGNVDAPRYFANALHYHMYFGPATAGGTFGTAILYDFRSRTSAPYTVIATSMKLGLPWRNSRWPDGESHFLTAIRTEATTPNRPT